jgi:hypothetical protein
MACFRPFFGFQKLIIQWYLPLTTGNLLLWNTGFSLPAGDATGSEEECRKENFQCHHVGGTREFAVMRVTQGQRSADIRIAP